MAESPRRALPPPAIEIPLQSNMSAAETPSLPSSPSDADARVELPFVTPSCALALQSKRVWLVRNALVASRLASCGLDALAAAADSRAAAERLDRDEFVALVRALPELRTGETFKPVEDTLERIFRSFEAANRTDAHQLATGCLVLLPGDARRKLELAIRLSLRGCGVDGAGPATLSIVRAALSCLLLSVSAVFDLETATPDQLQSTASIVATCVDETVARMFAANALGKDDTASFEQHVWPWIEANSSASKAAYWIKLLDQKKWPGSKKLTPRSPQSSPTKWGLPEDPPPTTSDGGDDDADYDDDDDDDDDSTAELSFRFSSVDGGVLTIGEQQAIDMYDLLVQSAFTRVAPQAMYDTFVQHTGDGLLEEETFLEAIEELLSMTDKPHLMENNAFLESMLSIFRAFLPEKCPTVDAFEIAAGFSLMSWGSKSDKLASAFHYFDADCKGYLNRQQLWRFLRSVLITLLHLSPPTDAVLHRYGSLAELVDKGEEDILEAIMEGLPDDDGEEDEDEDGDDASHGDSKQEKSGVGSEDSGEYDEIDGDRARANSDMRLGLYTFEDFGLWYNGGGFKGMSWLELLDLRKWVFVSPSFNLEGLDTRSVDPIVASNNYYTANNIQVDIDAVDPPDGVPGVKKPYFTFADVIDEEDDEDEDAERGSEPNYPESDMTVLDTTAFRSANRYAVEAGMDAVTGIANLITSPTASAAAAKDLSSVALQFKLTSYDNTTLRIRLKDVAIVYTISERMNFSRMTCGELVHLLKKHAHNRSLTKPGYLRAMRDLVPRDELSNEDQEFLSFHLLRIFTLFESESVLQGNESNDNDSAEDNDDQNGRLGNGVGMNTISVETLQLVAAKEAFEASKREKPLIYAFDMLEEGSILHFTESDISTYLFMLRSTKLGELSVSKVYDALLAYATPSAEEALKMSKAVGTQSRRGQMYSYAAVEEDEGAYLVLTRPNFYECVRSLVSKDGMSEKAQQTSSKLLSRLFNVFDRKRCGRVNALELACGLSILGRGSKSQKLSLAFDFITKMRQQRHKTLASYAPPPPSTAVGFGGFGAQGIATGGFGFGLAGAQSNQFSMSGAGGFGFPSTRGLGSTAQGMRGGMNRQPPPLSVAEVNALPHSVLFIYLRSFLLALMALSDGTYRLGLEKIYVEADDFIEEAMGDLMTDVTANGGTNAASSTALSGYGSARSRARVTFEQFGEWYNTGGYQLISWVELLDVSKWQQQQDFQEQSMSTAGPASTYQSKRMAPVMGSQTRGPMSTAAPMPVEPMQPIQRSTKPVTRRRQVRQSDIVSTPFVRGLPGDRSDPKPDPRESAGAISLSSDGPVMVFAVAKDAAELQFFNEDISTLKLFLRQTQLHTVTSWELQGAVLEALDFPTANSNGIMVTRRNMFMRGLQQVCGTLPLITPSSGSSGQTGFLSDEGTEMLHRLLGVFVHEPASDDEGEQLATDGDDDDESEDPIDIGAAICGLLVVCEGSLLEKLKCCAALISNEDGENTLKGEGEGEGETDVPTVTLETIKSSLMCFLMAFYGMSSSLSAEVARYSAELGADAVLQSFVDSTLEDEDADVNADDLDLEKQVSLREFSAWFGEAGYPSHPWLELAELNHWPAAINVCGSNGITDDSDDERD
ncbi:Guanylyl cyclase inhibitory protein [Phytophthora cinnamomi]|uniref:Guanylyl cyclase inhibitory protein n=1 Tax=Phytophthora cinnamomi TaxID=4785 RepID=UPI00355978EE|nr:Guanylyl cyclase inhibitory protein [Phytophthora cinnamomi]